MSITLKISGLKETEKYLSLKPKQITRASRLAVNQIAGVIHKELGSQLPKTAAIGIAGYKKVRTRKKKAKGFTAASIWLGTKNVAAIYAKGVIRSDGYNVYKGKSLFENAFVAKAKSGHEYIAYRIGTNKLKEATVAMPQSHAQTMALLKGKTPSFENIVTAQLEKEFNRIN